MRYFGRLRALAAFVLGALLASTGAGCGGSGQAREAEQAFRRDFRAVYEQYRRFETDKALVLAHDQEGRWAYGFARAQVGEMQALNAAKEQCRRRRAQYGVQAPCRAYALNGEITGDPALVEARPQE